jgi:hypothetical protein
MLTSEQIAQAVVQQHCDRFNGLSFSDERRADLARLITDALETQAMQHRAQLAEAEAGAAAMREALVTTRDALIDAGQGAMRFVSTLNSIAVALSTSTGRRLLAEHEAAMRTLARLGEWTHQYGDALRPIGPDTYGEGVRSCKEQVARILAALPAPEQGQDGYEGNWGMDQAGVFAGPTHLPGCTGHPCDCGGER